MTTIKQALRKTDGTIKYRNYIKKEKLGEGGFGQCFLVQRLEDKKRYAIKIVSKRCLQKRQSRQKMRQQIKLHRECKHKNICQLERAFQDQDNVYMLLQLCRNGNMFDLMKRRKKLTIPEVQYITIQLIHAMCYLHSRQIIHRDIKLGNLLLADDLTLKVADFGLASNIQFIGDKKHTVCGTPNYMPPQIVQQKLGIRHNGHSYESDIWSIGVIIYMMLIGCPPFLGKHKEKTFQHILNLDYRFPESFKNNQAKDIIKKILILDPSKRLTFEQILQHPFMNPKNGIPQQLPPCSMTIAPKFGIFSTSNQQQVKKLAKSASILTLRSQIDQTMREELETKRFSKLESITNSQKSISKDPRRLLRSIYSTSSLHKSIQKLSSLSRQKDSHMKQSLRGIGGLSKSSSSSFLNSTNQLLSRSNINSSLHKLKISKFNSIQMPQMENSSKNEIIEETGLVYVLEFKKQIIWSYIMSSGYIGTYETKNNYYKILCNPKQNMYYEIVNDQVPVNIKLQNEHILNRFKFIKPFIQKRTPCSSSPHGFVYIKKIFQIKTQNLVLFKLSNENIQAYNYELFLTIIIEENQITLIKIQNGREANRVSVNRTKYTQCNNKSLITMYLNVKKILCKINNLGKQ